MKRIISIILALSVFILPTLAFADSVAVGDFIPDKMPSWAAGQEAKIAEMVIAEYEAQKAAGFNLGNPEDAIQSWNDVVARQLFKGGDNKGNPWGWGATGYVGFIMVSKDAKQAYTLKNEMLDAWAALGHFDSVGAPTSNQFEENGKIYQNFSKGYIVCDAGDSTTAELKEGVKQQVASEQKAADALNPKTGDASMIGYVVLSLVGLAGVTLVKKRK